MVNTEREVAYGISWNTYGRDAQIVSEYRGMLYEVYEILEYHGVETQEFSSQSKSQFRKSVPFMYSIIVDGVVRWEGEKLRVKTRYKKKNVTVYLEPDRIHEAAYWIERRRFVKGTLLARKACYRRTLREEHIRDARREAKCLG